MCSLIRIACSVDEGHANININTVSRPSQSTRLVDSIRCLSPRSRFAIEQKILELRDWWLQVIVSLHMYYVSMPGLLVSATTMGVCFGKNCQMIPGLDPSGNSGQALRDYGSLLLGLGSSVMEKIQNRIEAI